MIAAVRRRPFKARPPTNSILTLQFPVLFDDSGNPLNGRVDFFFSQFGVDGEAHGRFVDVFAATHCHQNRSRLSRTAGAGAAERTGNAFQVECDEQCFTIGSGERNVERVWQPLLGWTVNDGWLAGLTETVFQAITQ